MKKDAPHEWTGRPRPSLLFRPLWRPVNRAHAAKADLTVDAVLVLPWAWRP